MPISAPPKWVDIKNKPNTVSGFGITDMASQSVASAVNATNASNAPWSGVSGKPTTISGYGITDEKCKAWVNFDGTGTVAIKASFNVSSITDLAVGTYKINLTNSMPDTNFAISAATIGASGNTPYRMLEHDSVGFRTVNMIPIYILNATGTPIDGPTAQVAVFR